MTTKTVPVDEARLRSLIEKAEKYDTSAAGAAAGDQPASQPAGGQRSASLRERVASQVLHAQRDYVPGATLAGDGPLAELRPSARALAAHVAMSIERDPNSEARIQRGSYAPASMVRSWLGGAGKRFNTGATDGIGAELVDAAPLQEIWKSAMCRSDLLQRFDPKPFKGGTMKIVNLTGTPTVYSTAPAEDCAELECRTSSPVGTRTHEHAAGKLTVDLCMPVELEEDSFLDVIAEYSEVAEEAMSLAQENALIRGDATLAGTTNINNTGTAITLSAAGQAPSWSVFDGLAHATIIDNVANNLTAAGGFSAGDSIVADDIMKLRPLMWDANSKRHFGFCSPEALMVIADAQTYAKLVTLEDVKWIEKFGPDATIITGLLPSIWGVPIYMAPALELTNGAGKIDTATPGNNIYGQLHLVNRSGFRAGVARDVQVLTEVDKRCDVVHVYITWRGAFARRSGAATAAGIEAVASIYGIAAA